MTTWLLAWVAVPLLTLVISIGLGLLVDRLLRTRLSLAVLVGVGFASFVALSTLFTEFSATAKWASVIVFVLALVGWALGGTRLFERPRWWSGIAAAATYLVYALPIAVLGVTWAGFIKLDDTADWMAFAERLVTVGHNTDSLGHTSYGRLIDVNWSAGYPVGAFGDLGVVSQLLHLDVAWAVQPFMAVTAAILAWTHYAVTDGLVRNRALRALSSVIAASSALLLGYVLWGGLKEVTLAALLAIACVAVTQGERDRQSPYAHALLIAIPLAAIFGVFGLAGLVYIAPIALIDIALLLRTAGWRAALQATGAFVVAFAILSIPILRNLGVQIAQLRTASLTSDADIGNLFAPLKFWQVFGIWPTGDFRVVPEALAITIFLIALAVVMAALGLFAAVRVRRPRLLAYVGVALLVATYSVFGNAWLEGKSLAVSSPAPLLAAGVGCAWLIENRRKFEGLVLGGILVLGVATSVVLGFSVMSPAPSERMQELADIGNSPLPKPALMLEYSPVGVRWFLRNLDAEGAGELRWNLIPTYTGDGLPRAAYGDIDEFPLTSLSPYPTLVLRNYLNGSRPPSAWRLERAGGGYDVWVADPGAPQIIEHYPLGTHDDPAANVPCTLVTKAAKAAGTGGRVAFVRRAPLITVNLADGPLPSGWTAGATAGSVQAANAGTISRNFSVPTNGDYRMAIGGLLFGPVTVSVDGKVVATQGPSLNWDSYGTPMPPVNLGAGSHTLEVSYSPSLSPGQAQSPVTFGPVQLSQQGPEAPVEYLPAAQAQGLCGQRLDWIEAVR